MRKEDHWLFQDISPEERAELEKRARLESAENSTAIWCVLTILAALIVLVIWFVQNPKPLYIHVLLALTSSAAVHCGISLHRLRSAQYRLLKELGGRAMYIRVNGRQYPLGWHEFNERALRRHQLIGRLSQEALEGLGSVEPSIQRAAGFVRPPARDEFYPCQVILQDGTIVDRVYLVAKSRIADRWNWELLNADPEVLIQADQIAHIESSPVRIPLAIANELHQHGETSMGRLDFVLHFRNGRRIPYSVPSIPCDFLEFTPTLSPQDIAFVKIGRNGTTGHSLGLASYRVCFYQDEPAQAPDTADAGSAWDEAAASTSFLDIRPPNAAPHWQYASQENNDFDDDHDWESRGLDSSRDAFNASVERFVSGLSAQERFELERRRRTATFALITTAVAHVSFWLMLAVIFFGSNRLSDEAAGGAFILLAISWVVWGVISLRAKHRLRQLMNSPHAEELFLDTGRHTYYLTADQLQRIGEQGTVWLSGELFRQLTAIEPGSLRCGTWSEFSEACRYYPCQLHLADGRVLERVYAVPASAHKECSCLPLQSGRTIAPQNIMRIDKSPWRVPTEVSRNWIPIQGAVPHTCCSISFEGGPTRNYVFSGVPPDFPLYPSGFGPQDIVATALLDEPAPGSFGSADFYILVYDHVTAPGS